jgi:hypothetical protein
MPPSGTTSLPSPLLSHGRLVEIDDSYILIPLDQPTMLARFLRSSIGDADTTGPAAMNAELWCVVGTALATVLFVVIPSVVYAYYVLESWIGDKTSYERVMSQLDRRK